MTVLPLQNSQLPRVAVIWPRLGPYHITRLVGAADQAKNMAHIIGIEIAETDDDYGWAPVTGAYNFTRHVVFPNRSYHELASKAIASGITATLDRLKPEVLAINGWSAIEARASLKWAVRNKARAILMSETKEDDSKRLLWKEVAKRFYVHRFDSAIVGGSQQKNYLIKLGMPPNNILLGYDVVDNSYFESKAAIARCNEKKIRQKLNLPKNYIFACTRLLPRKNVDGLLRAYAQYRSISQRPWSLVIAGDGAERDRLLKLEKHLGLSGVIWPGFVQYPQLPVYYGLASAFIHAAKSEAWGLVVNEAAASGLPLLVSNTVGAHYELVEEGGNGFVFDPFDANAICDSLLHITSASASQRIAMGNKSLAVVKEWGPERFGKELLTAGRIAINNKKAGYKSQRVPSCTNR